MSSTTTPVRIFVLVAGKLFVVVYGVVVSMMTYWTMMMMMKQTGRRQGRRGQAAGNAPRQIVQQRIHY